MPNNLTRINTLINQLESDLKKLKLAVRELEKQNKKSSHKKSTEAYRRAHRWYKDYVES